jgi:hypothetical protein
MSLYRRNSKRALITLAMVHDELGKSNDFLKGILPLFSPIAHDLAGQVFDVKALQKFLSSGFGLNIPEEILGIFPPRLLAMGLVERRGIADGSLYCWREKENLPPLTDDDFSSKIDSVVSAFQVFIDSESLLTTSGWSRNKIEDVLFDFLVDSLEGMQTAFDAINKVAPSDRARAHQSEE